MMMISGYGLLAIGSPAQELQGTAEEGSGFGQLLTEIETRATAPAEQEEGERRALESVFQFFLTMVQSLTPATPVQTSAASEAGTSGPGAARAGITPETLLSTSAAVFAGRADQSALAASRPAALRDGFAAVTDRSEHTRNLSGPLPLRPAPLEPLAGGVLSEIPPASLGALPAESQDSALATPVAASARPAGPAGATAPTVALDHPLAPAGAGIASEVSASTRQTLLQAQLQTARPDAGQPLRSGVSPLDVPLAEEQTSLLAVSPDVLPLQAPGGPALPHHGPSGVGQEPFQSHSVQHLPGLPALVSPPPAVVHATAVQFVASAATGTAAVPDPAAVPAADEDSREAEGASLASEIRPGLLHLADGSFAPPLYAESASTPAVESGAADTPASHTLHSTADTRAWPRPLPSNTMLLHLEPHELGTVLVQVRVSDKRLIASFRAQSPEVEHLLRAHLPALHESLSQQGFEVQPMVVSPSAEGFSAPMGAGSGTLTQQQSAFQAFTQEQPTPRRRDAQPETEVNTTLPWTTERGHRLLDVRI